MTGIYAAVGGYALPTCPDPFEDNDSKLCAVCGEYKRDVEDYRICEVTIPMCEDCLTAGQDAVAEVESAMTAADYAARNESILDYLAAVDAFAESAGFDDYDPADSPVDWMGNVLCAMEAQQVIEEVAE